MGDIQCKKAWGCTCRGCQLELDILDEANHHAYKPYCGCFRCKCIELGVQEVTYDTLLGRPPRANVIEVDFKARKRL